MLFTIKKLCALFLFFCMLALAYLDCIAAPYIAFTNVHEETGVVKDGRKGIYLVGDAKLSDLEGKMVGFMGAIYKNGKTISKSTWQDMQVVDKVTYQNIPMVRVFVPTDSLEPGSYRAAIYAFNYSENPPKSISDYDIHLKIEPQEYNVEVLENPTAENPTVKVRVNASEPIKDVYILAGNVIGKYEETNGSTSVVCSGTLDGKYGRVVLIIRATTVSGNKIRAERSVYINPPVLIENVRLIPNMYGGDYHKLNYDCVSRMPRGARYGLQAKVYELRHNELSPFKDENHYLAYSDNQVYKSPFGFKIQSEAVDTVSDAQILIPTDKLKLDPAKKYKVVLIPYIYNDRNWDMCYEGSFLSLYNGYNLISVDSLKEDQNGVVISWLEMPKETDMSTIQVKVGIKSPTTLKNVSFEVNGQKMRGVNVVKNDGYDMVLTETIALAEGYNEVSVIAENQKGKKKAIKDIIRKTSNKTNPRTAKQSALVIGNAAYPGNELVNTANDAADMSSELQNLGFEVMQLTNGTKEQTEKIIEQFAAKAALMKVSYLFYAGHAVQLNGVNYLIPVDAAISSSDDIISHCVNLDEIINKLDESGCELKIFSLDACRNNPFVKNNMLKGLSRLNTPAAIGTMVSFATAPGSVALDGTGRNSPYTTALLSVLNVPRLTLDQVFNQVGLKVVESTGKQQLPWITKTVLNGDFIFNKK